MALTDKLTAIGNALREKLGTAELIPLAQMPQKVAQTFQAGQQAERKTFWDVFQQGGTVPQSYTYAFYGEKWTDENFNPQHPLYLGDNSNYAFLGSGITDTKVDIVLHKNANTNNLFKSCARLRRVRKLVVTENNSYLNAFAGCTALENLTIEGVIGNDLKVDECPLTRESLLSILQALKAGVSKTLTLGQANLDKLTEQEKAIATDKGWVLQ